MSPANTFRLNLHFLYLLSLFPLVSGLISDELQILLTIKASLQNPNTNVFDSWNSNNLPCSNFTGITCNPDGSVKAIELLNQRLTGIVPFHSICQLQSPQKPSLGGNSLIGPLSELGEFKKLENLSVNMNQLTGPLPRNLGSWAEFDLIDVSENFLTGPIPPAICKMGKMRKLLMIQNKLTGEIPATYANCTSLLRFHVSNNSLSGVVPANLSSLSLNLIDLSYNRLTGSSDSGDSQYLRVTILAVAAGTIVLLLLVLCISYFKKSKNNDQDRSLKEDSWDVKSFHILTFTEDEILDSIQQENLIGKGRSGNVYRVSLANGKELAVKHIWNSDSGGWKKYPSTSSMLTKRAGKSKEFDAEVKTWSEIRHINVVKLCCSITSEDSSLLVYEYMPNGSLWDQLHTCKKTAMDWKTRYEIAVGAAKGLAYLHHGCERPVIHRDVKSSNIFLDEFLKPRIADFGLAKIVQGQTHSSKDSTHVIAGTSGYIALEYGYIYKVNEKRDVYSFRVVLMELVTGKRSIKPEFGENKDIVNWVSNKLKSKEIVLSTVDSTIPEAYKEEAIKVLKIAIHCTSRLPALRPTMRSVVQMLEEADPCKLVGIIISKDGGSKKEEVMDYDKVKSRPVNRSDLDLF